MAANHIIIKGARQNNLKNINLKIPLNSLIVITGLSGSGKSSLAFDTLYAEGQRRYVETFSPYTRQFLNRMDRPDVDKIDNIPPSIAIDQVNPVKTSRSTVGTMTELTDHIKLLFAKYGRLYCRECGNEVKRENPEQIFEELINRYGSQIEKDVKEGPQYKKLLLVISFFVSPPHGFSVEQTIGMLQSEGFYRNRVCEDGRIEVIQDRVALESRNRTRIIQDLESAMEYGRGKVRVQVLTKDNRTVADRYFSRGLQCARCNISYSDPSPNLFSFNSPVGACSTCRGFGRIIDIDVDLVVPDKRKTLEEGAIKVFQSQSYYECQEDLIYFAKKRGIRTDIPWIELTEEEKRWVIEGEGRWEDGKWYGVKSFFRWLESKSYKMHIRVLLSKYRSYVICPDCGGSRLKPEALLYRIGPGEGLNIHEVHSLSIDEAYRFFVDLHRDLKRDRAYDLILDEIVTRLGYLVEVGLGYLTLDRQSRTLSGGEVQRINLTTALGTSLVNTLFILDEPSIGLHPSNITRLIGILKKLRDSGNTIVVVEHDPKIISSADMIIELGPGSGKDGGRVVFSGPFEEFINCRDSITAKYLKGELRAATFFNQSTKERNGELNKKGNEGDGTGDSILHDRYHKIISARDLVGTLADKKESIGQKVLRVIGAREHNLKNIDVTIPLNRFVCITGVSGSGKSTLVEEIIYRGIRRAKHLPEEKPGLHERLEGVELIDEVILVDQSPIGKTPRSNPLSYVGALSPIRELFAETPDAQAGGFKSSSFSFNSKEGQCPHCRGSGFEHIEMQFLNDVYIRCPICGGKRFKKEILEIKIQPKENGKQLSIADVFELTVSEAYELFEHYPKIRRALKPLIDVGLDYLQLGQPVPTLSGGEAQRLKLAKHIAEAQSGKIKRKNILFLFDEPTTGLHFHDIKKLLSAFKTLVDGGHSIVVIEHNLDVIASSEWIIDLGPGGGDDGGWIVFEGTPDEIIKCERSLTGRELKRYIERGFIEPGRELEKVASPVAEYIGSGASRSENERAFYPESIQADIEPARWKTELVPSLYGRTGKSLRKRPAPEVNRFIEIKKAREHNLKEIDVHIPQNKMTVVTGVSGSGKSTLAFDILFSEGQRRYLESLNVYARQIIQPAKKPDVDNITGIPPTVAIEQRTTTGGIKSTVATVTEIYHFLRLLYAKVGVQYCVECGSEIKPQSPESIVDQIVENFSGRKVGFLAPLVVSRKGYYTELAKWAQKKGFKYLRVDGIMIPVHKWPRLDRFREHNIELPVEECVVEKASIERIKSVVERALEYGKGTMYVVCLDDLGKADASSYGENETRIYSTRRACPTCMKSYEEPDPRLFSFNSPYGWCRRCRGTGLTVSGSEEWYLDELVPREKSIYETKKTCPVCGGKRLRPEALSVKFRGYDIAALTAMTIEEAYEFFSSLELTSRERAVLKNILPEIVNRLSFLIYVGLPYLTLDRAAPTLSSGESERIRLAAQLGSNLRGVCYILDEPTIGLHPRDNQKLLKTLSTLKKKGNTVVVVEHDEQTINSADYIIDLGPGGGVKGGKLIYEGPAKRLFGCRESKTAEYLKNPMKHPIEPRTTYEELGFIVINGANMYNLKDIDVRIPLGRFICVTGVSGSGKTTLLFEVLYRNLKELLRSKKSKSGLGHTFTGCKEITGWDRISSILEVDQTPIGKTPRSCPATYIGFWDEIRKLMSMLPEARMRGYTPSRFSFNTAEGRCPRCAGQGWIRVEMNFLPDVDVLCEVCEGRRFDEETLSVKLRGKSVSDILEMSIDEAYEFFSFHERLHRMLELLKDTGLGYITLGQPSPTLSGGEAQRIKLVKELVKSINIYTRFSDKPKHNLYILDEPSIGLHMADVKNLILVLRKLVEAGNTIIVIEHNLDIIAEADWIIDLGPEGGDRGGQVIYQGPLDGILKAKNSYTGEFLKDFLNRKTSAA